MLCYLFIRIYISDLGIQRILCQIYGRSIAFAIQLSYLGIVIVNEKYRIATTKMINRRSLLMKLKYGQFVALVKERE